MNFDNGRRSFSSAFFLVSISFEAQFVNLLTHQNYGILY